MYIDWVIAFLNLYSTWLLVKQRPLMGWGLMSIASLGYIYLNYNAGLYGLAAGSVAFLVVEGIGFYKALKERNNNDT